MNGFDRLLQLRAENDAAGEIMRKEAPRFLQLARRHELGTAPQSVTGFNLFQTPRVIAARMADLIRERPIAAFGTAFAAGWIIAKLARS